MQHLIKTVTLIAFLCTSMTLSASEIKVYLNKIHADQITGVDEVKAQGYKVHFVYLDRLTELEDQISQRVTGDYQQSIDKIIDDVGLDNLIAMDDIERTDFFMHRFTQMKVKPVTPNTVLPSELSDVRHAIGEIIQAEEQGITEDLLPAVIVKGKLFKLTYDLTRVINND